MTHSNNAVRRKPFSLQLSVNAAKQTTKREEKQHDHFHIKPMELIHLENIYTRRQRNMKWNWTKFTNSKISLVDSILYCVWMQANDTESTQRHNNTICTLQSVCRGIRIQKKNVEVGNKISQKHKRPIWLTNANLFTHKEYRRADTYHHHKVRTH